jgi:hypothetical protein
VVALLPNGRISFQRLQNAFDAHIDSQLVYVVFDLLYLDGYDLRADRLCSSGNVSCRLSLQDNSSVHVDSI